MLVKYPEFLAVFPTIKALAGASIKDVLTVWQGLGYNRRALLVKRAAEAIVKNHSGKFPRTRESLEALPGIGQSTAGALCAFAFNAGVPFIETNIRAVYLDTFFKDTDKIRDADLLPLIAKTIDTKNPREWFYALMDYGVHLKSTLPNPSRKSAHHSRQSVFKGSNRELRANILRYILEKPCTEKDIIKHFIMAGKEQNQIQRNLTALKHEGFISCKRKRFAIAY